MTKKSINSPSCSSFESICNKRLVSFYSSKLFHYIVFAMAFHISVTDNKSYIVREYDEGIKLNGAYEVGLRSMVTYNNISNISPEKRNNVFYIKKVGKNTDGCVLTIPKGAYEVEDLISYIKNNEEVKKIEPNLSLKLNKNTLRVSMRMENSVIDVPPPDLGSAVLSILGFQYGRYEPNIQHVASGPVDIMPINTIRIRCNLIASNFDNLTRGDNTIYEFPLNAEVGEKIIERPNTVAYYTVITDSIYTLVLSIVDRNNNLVDFGGERISLNLEFRPIDPLHQRRK